MQDFTEIDLMPLVSALLRKLWLIVLCAVLTGGAAYFYTYYFVVPLYRAEVTVYVNNISSKIDSSSIEYVSGSNLSTAARLVTTYVNIISSDRVLSKVVEQADLDASADALRGMMTASSVGETEMFKIYITSADPEFAAKVANAIADVAPDEIANIVEGSSTKIIDYAKVPRSPSSPNYQHSVLTGAAVGAALAVAYVMLRTLLDKRIKSEEDLERLADLPVLGVIPEFGIEHKKGYGGEYSAQPAKGGDSA